LIGISLAILPFAFLVPYLILRRRARRRQKSVARALPDALDLLVTSVEAGLGVDAAFAMVTERTSGPLSQTFALYLKEVGLGRPRRDALAHVAERTGVPDLIRIAASVAQAEEIGTTLGDVLRTQAEDLRLLRRQRAQEAAQRAPVLMTIPLALCFLPAMVAVVIVPSILNLMQFISDLGNV
jgi:tight adherence protein C